MIINRFRSKQKSLEFEFKLEEESDKILLNEILTDILLVKFQVLIDEQEVNSLKLSKYNFTYDYDNKQKTFNEL